MGITTSALGFADGDQRQGVMRAGHDVLDALEGMRAAHLGARRGWGAVAHLETARAIAERSARSTVVATRRGLAVEAAAHAIFAIELLDGEDRP